MNILDEAKSLFYDGSMENNKHIDILAKALKSVDERTSMMRFIRCRRACSKCVGRKYNMVDNGCPVCGNPYESMTCSFVDAIRVYKCNKCKSTFISCGAGDIAAVGIIDKVFMTEEDII